MSNRAGWLSWLTAHAVGIGFWAALGAGVLFRVVRYLDDRSLWLDESFLAINLVEKSATALLDSLAFAQSAPPAFLLTEKGVLDLLGDSELSLRLVPLVSSIVALAAFAWIVRRLLSPWGAVLALTLFASNEYLIYQASELKQYSTDVTVAVVLLALYVWFERGTATARRAIPLLVAGTAAPLLSFPAALVLAGVGGAVLVRLWLAGSRRDLVVVGALMSMWVATFGLVIVMTSDTVRQISNQVFHGESSRGESLAHVVDLTWSVFVNPGGFTNGTNALAALLAALGLVAFIRSGPLWRPLALAVPPALAVLAAVVGKYPIGGRFSLFLVPFAILFVARGVEALVLGSRNRWFLGAALVVILLCTPLVTGVSRTLSPPRGEDVRPLLETAADGWRDGDTLYVFRNSQYALRYYTVCADCRPGGRTWPWPSHLAPLAAAGSSDQFAKALESVPPGLIVGSQAPGSDPTEADLARLPKRGRVWMLFSHVPTWEPLNQETLMRRELDARGRVVGEWRAGSADLVLYELA